MAEKYVRFKLVSSFELFVVDVGATANRPQISEWL
jgi:hypothetical protein